jgi:hypothetical protein
MGAEGRRLLVKRYIPRGDRRVDNLLNGSPGSRVVLILVKSRMVFKRAVRPPVSGVIRELLRMFVTNSREHNYGVRSFLSRGANIGIGLCHYTSTTRRD